MTGTTISTDRTPAEDAHAARPAEPERRTSSVELFWDLVFVFAVTQVTSLLSHHLYAVGSGLSAWELAAVIAGLLIVLAGLERIAWLRVRRNAPADLRFS